MDALHRIFSHDFSAETQDFSDDLLKKCTAVLDSGMVEQTLSDDDLDMITAAGTGSDFYREQLGYSSNHEDPLC